MVEVFKTNISDRRTADELLFVLQSVSPMCHINFDLEDCDNILRVEGKDIIPEKIIKHLSSLGFYCEQLN